MIVGKRHVGAKAIEIARDWKTVSRYSFATAGRLPKLSAYLDGLGGGDELASLTMSGNEVTDLTRKAAAALGTGASGQMCDGRSVDLSTGIRRAATNLFRHGQCDAVTDWNVVGSGVVTRAIDATVPAPFAPQSIKYTCDGTAANQGGAPRTATGLAAAAGTAGIGTVYFKGVAGQSYRVIGQWLHTDATIRSGQIDTFTASGAWELVIVFNSVAVGGGKTGDSFQVRIDTNGTRAESFWLAHAMIETGVLANAPYVATTGGATATHAAGLAQAPAALVNATRGWVALSLRVDVTSGFMNGFVTLFGWGISTSNYLWLFYDGTSFTLGRSTTGAGATFAFADMSVFHGDVVTVVAWWDATTLSVSVSDPSNIGFPLSSGTVAQSAIPTVADSLFTLGPFDSDAVWVAAGKGPLAPADVTALQALARPANIAALPSTSQPTMLWRGQTPNYRIPGVTGPATLVPVIYDAAGNLVVAGDPVTVAAGSAPAWYDFTFSKVPGGVPTLAAGYDIGFLVGGARSHVVRAFSDGSGMGQMLGDTYADGPATPFGTAWPTHEDISIYGDVFQPWTPPAGLDEFQYARLPLKEAQKAFSATAPVFGSGVVAQACWHGSALDPERGSFAVVQARGKLDALVGERVKITRTSFGVKRSVLAFVHNSVKIQAVGGVTPDLSLPRRLWAELALAGDDTIEVIVERLA